MTNANLELAGHEGLHGIELAGHEVDEVGVGKNHDALGLCGAGALAHRGRATLQVGQLTKSSKELHGSRLESSKAIRVHPRFFV